MSADWLAHPFKLIDSTGINSRGEIPRGHGCIRNAQLMALTHNTIFRGLNAVYHYAAQVERGSQEAADLLLHCYMVYDFIHVHHVSEEEVYFPRLEAAAGVPDLMKENIEQHKAFENTLEALKVYATQTSKEEYDAATLRGLIEAMVGPLGSHLHEEIPTILDLWDKIDSKTMNKIYGQMHDYATKSSDSFKYVCPHNVISKVTPCLTLSLKELAHSWFWLRIAAFSSTARAFGSRRCHPSPCSLWTTSSHENTLERGNSVLRTLTEYHIMGKCLRHYLAPMRSRWERCAVSKQNCLQREAIGAEQDFSRSCLLCWSGFGCINPLWRTSHCGQVP